MLELHCLPVHIGDKLQERNFHLFCYGFLVSDVKRVTMISRITL